MTFTPEAEHEFDDGSLIAVGFNRHGRAEVVMDGPGGVETVILFDEVHIRQRFIEFRRCYRVGETAPSGSLEGSPENYGEVGDWLEERDGQAVGVRGVA